MVHCDVDSTGSVDFQLCLLEDKGLDLLVFDCRLNTLDLLGDDRQHLKIDSVELIEAAPSSRGSKTFEELGHCEVIKTIGAVEHHTLHSNGFGEILDGLGLSCSAGPSGAPP